jgi:hypothetical protein
MRGQWNMLSGIHALGSSPDFHLVAIFGEGMAAPNGGVVTDMFAAVHREFLAPLDDTNLVIVHDASPISGMGSEPTRHKGIPRFLMLPAQTRPVAMLQVCCDDDAMPTHHCCGRASRHQLAHQTFCGHIAQRIQCSFS